MTRDHRGERNPNWRGGVQLDRSAYFRAYYLANKHRRRTSGYNARVQAAYRERHREAIKLCNHGGATMAEARAMLAECAERQSRRERNVVREEAHS